MPCSTWPSTVANGVACPKGLATGTPSIPACGWERAGVLYKMFQELQREQVVRIRIEAVSLDSTSIKVHPDGTGALKKTARNPSASPEADGTPRFIWLPRMLERP
jgi:hypothetical protein